MGEARLERWLRLSKEEIRRHIESKRGFQGLVLRRDRDALPYGRASDSMATVPLGSA